MLLEEVRAIVTGAAKGLGKKFSLELAKAGARVVAGDVDTSGLDELKAESTNLTGKIFIQELDVRQESSVVNFIHGAAEHLNGINVLVNNAGILRDGLLAKYDGGWTRKLPTAQWKQVLDANLTGPYLMTREIAANMLENGTRPGVIVNISSISSHGNPGQSNYAASKAGLDACTRTWALELAKYGIRVGGIAPGAIDTPMFRSLSEEVRESLTAANPLGRIGLPHDIWLALKFVIECDYFTGRVIEVDGGSQV
jgi:3-oxoacyl-[acyl-carrier protein] reductase